MSSLPRGSAIEPPSARGSANEGAVPLMEALLELTRKEPLLAERSVPPVCRGRDAMHNSSEWLTSQLDFSWRHFPIGVFI